jgi:4-diphosphocytidyl-2-C-methyl-D-erythritol kinase
MGMRVRRRAPATAKINLALVVGGVGDGGKHEVATVYQRLALCDRVAVERSAVLSVDGFAGDTIVRGALESLAGRTGAETLWRVRLTKRIPVAAGLGGGSSDAATALRLANATLREPLPDGDLRVLAATVGADVPFFLTQGPQLGTADGTHLEPVELPQDFHVLLLVPTGAVKESTASVYRAFDERRGAEGFDERRSMLTEALAGIHQPEHLARLPRNDLVSSPLVAELEDRGAFRADVSGAGPTVYGLFLDLNDAESAARAARRWGRVIVTKPCWYG